MVSEWRPFVCINYSSGSIKYIVWTIRRKSQVQNIFHFFNICLIISNHDLNLLHFSWIVMVTFKWCFGHEWRRVMQVLLSSSNHSFMDKTNRGYPYRLPTVTKQCGKHTWTPVRYVSTWCLNFQPYSFTNGCQLQRCSYVSASLCWNYFSVLKLLYNHDDDFVYSTIKTK